MCEFVRSGLSEITEEIHNIINNGMHCVTGAKLMTLWITRDKAAFVCSALRIETVSGWVLGELTKCWLLGSCVLSLFLISLPQKDNNRLTLCLFLLFYWPGSKSSHIGHRGRCLGGYELMAGFLHFGSVALQSTHSADEPGQTIGGSGTPPSRSEDPIHPRTACGWPQQLISWAQGRWCSLLSTQSNFEVQINMLGPSTSLFSNEHSSCIFPPTLRSFSKLTSTPSLHPSAFSFQPPFNISAQAHSCC